VYHLFGPNDNPSYCQTNIIKGNGQMNTILSQEAQDLIRDLIKPIPSTRYVVIIIIIITIIVIYIKFFVVGELLMFVTPYFGLI
jgi:t-SNARE complex subunit (syntaxin)